VTLPGDLSQFGEIDIYLFDQLLRGRIRPGMRVLDAGCGGGRNLIYMLRESHGSGNYDVFAADRDPAAVAHVQRLAASLAPHLPAQNIVVAPVEQMPFPDAFADVVISSAVLHFAKDDRQFEAMVHEMWRVLRRGGMLWARLASTIGIANEVRSIDGRWSLLPDGSERYLVDEPLLVEMTQKLGGRLLDPIKTTVVANQRAMTTWVAGKL
jgi:tellurite methyltransferase